MKAETTFRKMGGTWYMKINPSFAGHIGLDEVNQEEIIPGEIQDEIGKHGNYISGWKIPQKKEK